MSMPNRNIDSTMKAIFWVGKVGLFGSLIRVFKHRGISHSEIQFSDGKCATALTGSGIVLRQITVDPADWYVIDIPCTPEEEAQVRQFFIDADGDGYDWLGIIFAQVLGWNWSSKHNWTCSEACATALRRKFPALGRVPAACVDPAALAVMLQHEVTTNTPR